MYFSYRNAKTTTTTTTWKEVFDSFFYSDTICNAPSHPFKCLSPICSPPLSAPPLGLGLNRRAPLPHPHCTQLPDDQPRDPAKPPARPPANSICPHSDGGPGSRRCARRVTRTAFGAYPNPPRLETGSVHDCATKRRLSAKAAMTSLLQTASSIEHCWRLTLICIVLPFNSHGFKSRQTPRGWQAP